MVYSLSLHLTFTGGYASRHHMRCTGQENVKKSRKRCRPHAYYKWSYIKGMWTMETSKFDIEVPGSHEVYSSVTWLWLSLGLMRTWLTRVTAPALTCGCYFYTELTNSNQTLSTRGVYSSVSDCHHLILLSPQSPPDQASQADSNCRLLFILIISHRECRELAQPGLRRRSDINWHWINCQKMGCCGIRRGN